MNRCHRILLGLLSIGALHDAGAAATVRNLRCEYKTNPIGIDVPQPRLSWWIESDARGQVQTGSQILVASSEEKLKSNQGDLWDSGEIRGDVSIHVPYSGKPLASRQRCWWKVRIWDKAGQPSAFSEPACWEMGLLRRDDWKAAWIDFTPSDAAGGPVPGCNWIWAETGAAGGAPVGDRFFRKSFDIPAGRKAARAEVWISVDDKYVLFVNGREIGKLDEKDGWRSPRTYDVTPALVAGKNIVAVDASNTSASPAGFVGCLKVEWEGGGASLGLPTDTSWKCAKDRQVGWEQASFDDKGWEPARVAAPLGQGPWGQFPGKRNPAPYFRKPFPVAKAIQRARLYVTALGLYECRLNGKRVGDHLLAPEWQNYNIRLQYQAYDVAPLLLKGENVLAATLGDGWYCGHVGLTGRNVYGPRPALLAQLMIDYDDGTADVVSTGEGWKASSGPVLQADLLDGEIYDARKEPSGWDRPGFNDSGWTSASLRDESASKRVLEAQIGPPVRKLAEVTSKKLTEPKPGTHVFDLGQNLVGWARLKVRAPAGTKVTIRFAEMLNPDGTMYVTNLRGARCIDEYTCKGGGEETWEPRFTFHGFRYVEVTGLPAKPSPDAITGIVAGSDTPAAGAFECSHSAVNQLQSNIVWGQRGNYLSVPTDCPQRDERCGWMGDAQVFIRTATFNNEVASFFTKWLVDVDDAQEPNGAFPDIAPRVACGAGTPAWADAGVICPWTVYLCYGDRRILEQHYPAMVKWVEHCRKNSHGLVRADNQGGSNYGDWLSIGANTPKTVLNTAYFGYSTDLVAKTARVLGKEEDARSYGQLFADIQKAFQQKFVADDGRIQGHTQSGYLMALRFNLLTPEQQAMAVKHLVEDIQKKNTHLSTGFVGVSYLLPTLTRFGHTDLAYRLLNQDSFPSWLFSVKHGATTIWERWDGWTPERGFQDPGMNSFNHYSLGSCGEWMYATMAGIAPDPEKPGYKRIVMRLQPGGGFTQVKAHHDTMHGRIASAWKISGGTFSWDVTIPANTIATVFIPGKDAARVKEGGKPAGSSEGVKFLQVEDGTCLYEVGSGVYTFTVPAP